MVNNLTNYSELFGLRIPRPACLYAQQDMQFITYLARHIMHFIINHSLAILNFE